MSEERNCKNCAKSSHSNRGIPCNESGCFGSNGYPYFRSIDEYPKPATFLEAVEWMEKGNNAESPKGKSCIYIYNNTFHDVYGKHKYMIITPDIIKGEWKLLAPDKPEKCYNNNCVCYKLAMPHQCERYYKENFSDCHLFMPDKPEPEIMNNDDIRKELLSIKSEIDSILERMGLLR